jgi:hypothetical protein
MMQFGPDITLPFVIDISGLEDGVYILKLTDEDGEMESRKFVKAGKH